MSAEILKYGMVGGGPGAFIGEVHRTAARFDGKNILTAGSFSRDYQKTLKTGKDLGIDENRLYKNYTEMAEKESELADGIDFVSVVTPNHTHFEVAEAFLSQGISVVCDKPVTTSSQEASKLKQLAEKNDAEFCVTYTYSGYPMVKEAKELVEKGEIGDIRVIMGEYPQEWLAEPTEEENKQASWRIDPNQAGISNCIGDIGSHIEHTVSYISGLEISKLSANLDTFVAGRELDDNGEVMIKYENGATGMYWASQVAVGNDNGLKVRIFGSKGSLEWSQENPNYLYFSKLGEATKILSRGHGYLGNEAQKSNRIPPGHPEGYFEAFANIYANFSAALLEKKKKGKIEEQDFDYPTITEGLRGVKFIEKCVASSQQGASWVDFE